MKIGAVVFDDMDQIDFTGPYEVLATLDNTTYTVWPIRPTRP